MWHRMLLLWQACRGVGDCSRLVHGRHIHPSYNSADILPQHMCLCQPELLVQGRHAHLSLKLACALVAGAMLPLPVSLGQATRPLHAVNERDGLTEGEIRCCVAVAACAHDASPSACSRRGC